MNTQMSEHDDEDDVPTPHRPPSPQDEYEEEDSDDDDYPDARRSAGYSRVEKMLADNKDLGIIIPEAGKNPEGSGGGYIVYTIRTGVCLSSPSP